MKTFKTTIIIPVLFLVVLGIHPTLQAQIVEMDKVSFNVYDLDGDGKATINTLSTANEMQLMYSLDGENYSDVINPNIEINFYSGKKEQIFFQLQAPDSSIDQDGRVTFMSQDFPASYGGNDMYRNLLVQWYGPEVEPGFDPSDPNYFTYTFSSADANARFSTVPIPPAALLLLSGITGLIGFRKIIPK